MNTQLDPGSKSTWEEIERDIERLGLDAKFIMGTDEIGLYYLIFKSKEDMNYYRIAGKWNNFWWIKYELESDE